MHTFSNTSPVQADDLSVAPSPVVPRPVPSRRRKTLRALAADSGQGTVEYVGLLLLMATVLGGVVAASGALGKNEKIGETVVKQVSKSIDNVGNTKIDK